MCYAVVRCGAVWRGVVRCGAVVRVNDLWRIPFSGMKRIFAAVIAHAQNFVCERVAAKRAPLLLRVLLA